ncbi:MAG: N-acetyltransferase [Kofleriaceae bacterium]|nr:N-acetyltransferase [Kofleriaceae bacterium]MCB9574985.1 N-acetyltransferase [Kofleriaceae bacterium]
MSDAADTSEPFVHPSAVVDPGATIGPGTRIWHFVHVMPEARIGARCVIGQGCFVGPVTIGDGCRIQNNVSVFDGVTLEDEVFVGPSAVFTNVNNPRAHVSRRHEFARTVVKRGASIGANATIVCGVTIGEHAFIGAGAVVRHDVAPHAVVVGVPAGWIGWMCRCGERLPHADGTGRMTCAACGERYRTRDGGVARDA